VPAPYIGVGSHVVQSVSPTIQEYADLDDLNAANLTPPIRTILDHIALIWRGEFHGTTSSSPGLIGVGGLTAPGVVAQAGGANRGSLNLVPQAIPSGPSDGDVWVTGTGIFARVAGVTIGPLAAATPPPPPPNWGALFYAAIPPSSTSDPGMDEGNYATRTTLDWRLNPPYTYHTVVGWNNGSSGGGTTVNTATGIITIGVTGTYKVRAFGDVSIYVEGTVLAGGTETVRATIVLVRNGTVFVTANRELEPGGPGSLVGNGHSTINWEGVLNAGDTLRLMAYDSDVHAAGDTNDTGSLVLVSGYMFDVQKVS